MLSYNKSFAHMFLLIRTKFSDEWRGLYPSWLFSSSRQISMIKAED